MSDMEPNTPKTLSSIGIDIGTTTTQVLVSELELATPTYNGAAKVEILNRQIRYRSPIRETPFLDEQTIDTAAVLQFIERELCAAGVLAKDIDTGAVIATGKAARKSNAEQLVNRLAERIGEFVVATAGASLEAVLAGYGSGAGERSRTNGSTIVTADIGGGTTNIAVFENGDVQQTRCLDIGGRLVEFGDDQTVTSVSDALTVVQSVDGSPIEVGASRSVSRWRTLATRMAAYVFDCLEGPPFNRVTEQLSISELPDESVEMDEIVFTGGVGRLVSDATIDELDLFEYNDLGVFLADAIRTHERFNALPVRQSTEDIRATAIGVGTRTTTFTGRTIAPAAELLPARNLPVIALENLTTATTVESVRERTKRSIRVKRKRREISRTFALYISDVGPLTYDRLQIVAHGIVEAYADRLATSQPLILVTRQNCAKVLGQLFESKLENRPTMVLDELTVAEDEFLDFGMPIGETTTVPVTIKTLVFDE